MPEPRLINVPPPSLPYGMPQDEAEVDLSIIVPAYNETERLPVMLDEAVEVLETRREADPSFDYEIIVVDDGSKDQTTQVALEMAKRLAKGRIRVMTLHENRGKGGAVKRGVLCARGHSILFADADGATQFSDLTQLETQLLPLVKDHPMGYGVTIGSRSHLVETDAVVKRSMLRNFLMHSFHRFLYLLGVRTIKDTQCGFKLFSRPAAQILFPTSHVEGWIFDVELLLIAEMSRMPVAEIPVTWHEVGGSKVNLVNDSIQMALDLLILRLNYWLRIWALPTMLNEAEGKMATPVSAY
ncbi:MAG: nucleotide-diphospho-sugar transferase [Piptocephalis tieghemiana]|nr:MAG: nucleotide-diphospho-sugar transferase [Piptocephalis tieghemiana]